MSQETFMRQIDQWKPKAEAMVLLQIRRAVVFFHDLVVDRTPIDTGRARSSWNVAVGQADLTTTPLLKGPHAPSGAGPLYARQAKGVANSTRRSLDNLSAGTPVAIVSNNLDYIVPLENGHSKQAPIGMFAITYQDMLDEFTRVVP